MAKVLYTTPGFTIAQLLARVSEAMGWDATDTTRLAEMNQAVTAAGQAATTFEGRPWWWSRKLGMFRTKTLTIETVANGGAVRSSNVTTIKTTASHALGEGQYVQLSSVSDSSFDGAFRISSIASATTFTIAQEGDDVGAATAGTGTVSVISYPLRQVNTKSMQDLWAPMSVWRDNSGRLPQVTKQEFDLWLSFPNTTAAPFQYALFEDDYKVSAGSFTRELYMGLLPAPDASTYDITVPYVVRHGAIDLTATSGSEDASLIVPGEFHRGVYVDGALWLLKHDTEDPSALQNAAIFKPVMRQMQMADPTWDYDDEFAGIGLPADQKVFVTAGGLTP